MDFLNILLASVYICVQLSDLFAIPIKQSFFKKKNRCKEIQFRLFLFVIFDKLIVQGKKICVSQSSDYSATKPGLPEKIEYVIKVRMSNVQIALYKEYLEKFAKMKVKKDLFTDYQKLASVWNHPYTLLIRASQEDEIEVL